MPPQLQDKQHKDHELRECLQRNTAIGRHVLLILGQPGNLQRIQVRPLWEDHFRVNVLVGLDATSANVAHSYFLKVDGDGNIIAATPKLTRQY